MKNALTLARVLEKQLCNIGAIQESVNDSSAARMGGGRGKGWGFNKPKNTKKERMRELKQVN